MSATSTRKSATGTSSARGKARDFPNGDQYEGEWTDGVPDGHGRYTWKDGSFYDGTWQAGSRSGAGVYVWPTGARYRGEWKDGFMHGVGTLTAPNSAIYQGGWCMDLKHGLGRKVYANGDTYEGLWRDGRAEGPGRYKWSNGNEFDGQWQGGRMHGQGTLMWSSGDRYDGEFNQGKEDGLGIFTWADNTTYEGHWQAGQKHGMGLYRPATEPDRKSLALRHEGVTAVVEAVPTGGKREGEGSAFHNYENPLPNPQPQDQGAVDAGEAAQAWEAQGGEGRDRRQPSEAVFVREYEQGKMVRSELLSGEELELVGAVPKPPRKARRKRRTEQQAGETIYKGHRSYDLMLNLQLGIRHSVTTVSAAAAVTSLDHSHFNAKVKLSFPRDGSKATPPHPSGDFRWKDYTPLAFRQLRETFCIDAAQYMTSICGDLALRELPSPGKSGSVFFLSHDDRYIIKTMRKGEVKLLLELLPRYCEHVEKHPHTLLIKFYGLHRVQPLKGAKVRFVVMNNLFQTPLPIHRRYDLKGSTQGRGAGTTEPDGAGTILKDLDLNIQLKLEEGWHQRLMWQLSEDCRLLEQLHVMDYSLLLGVSFCNPGYASSPPATDRDDEADDDRDDTPLSEALSINPFLAATGKLPPAESPAVTSRRPLADSPDKGSHPLQLRSVESAAAVAFATSSAEADRSKSPVPAFLPRFESQPLRQNSEPPGPEPEPPGPSAASPSSPRDPPHPSRTPNKSPSANEKRLSRFASPAGTPEMGSSPEKATGRLGSESSSPAGLTDSGTEGNLPGPPSADSAAQDLSSPGADSASADLAHASSAPAQRRTASQGARMMRVPSAPLRAASQQPQRAGMAHRRTLSTNLDDHGKAGKPEVGRAAAEQLAAEAEVRRRVGGGMSQKRMADLVALAQCRTLAQRLRHARSATLLLAMRPQRSLANRPVASGPGGADELAHALGQTRVQLGANMPAVAQSLPARSSDEPQSPVSPNEDAILFFGIIDILQEYNMSKRFEHGLKAMRHDSATISAVEPKQYSRRFQDFLKRLFV